MSLFDELFPSFYDLDCAVPYFPDKSAPWSILSNDNYGLNSQLMSIQGADDGIFIHPDARIGEFVRVESPCYIGAKAEIRHSAYLRAGSWVCKEAVVGHSSEVKNSILLPNSKAPHFNYVGDSILGIGVNIGAGVKLSNVRNDRKEVTIKLANGERLGTGLRKLGALIGDGSQLGCNVVTNPGTIIAPSSMISPNETISGWFDSMS